MKKDFVDLSFSLFGHVYLETAVGRSSSCDSHNADRQMRLSDIISEHPANNPLDILHQMEVLTTEWLRPLFGNDDWSRRPIDRKNKKREKRYFMRLS